MRMPSRLRLGVMAVAIGLAGCAISAPAPSPVRPASPRQSTVPAPSVKPAAAPGLTISGTFGLRRGPVVRDANGCHGTGSNADVETGGVVIVLDAATGTELGTGVLVDDPSRGDEKSAGRYVECWFRFSVKDVPEASAYSIVAPGFAVSYTRSELRQLAGQLMFATGGLAPEIAGIPGLSVADIERELGIDCVRGLSFGDLRTFACDGARGGVPIALVIDAREDGSVLRIQAAVSEAHAPQGATVSSSFLRDVAALPWSGTDPIAARAWVDEALAAGGSTDIGGARLEIDAEWPVQSRGLTILGRGDPLPPGEVPPLAPTDIAATKIPALCPGEVEMRRFPCVVAEISWMPGSGDAAVYRIYQSQSGEDPNATCRPDGVLFLTTGVDAWSATAGPFVPVTRGGGRCLYVAAANTAGESARVQVPGGLMLP